MHIRPETLTFTLVLGALAALPSISIDMTTPTLPILQVALGASSTATAMTITLFMFGFAIGQFGAGTLSDYYGRRPTLLVGLAAFVVAGLGTALAPTVGALTVCRLLQGVAAGAGTVLSFAMIRDLYEGDEARSKRSYILVVFSIAPMIAPTLGGLILEATGWRGVYLALPIAGALLLAVAAVGIGESRRVSATGSPSLKNIAAAYRDVVATPTFRTPMAINAATFASMFAYVAGSPFVFMDGLGLSVSAYGILFACTAGGLMAGSLVSGYASRRGVSADALLSIGLVAAAASALAMTAASATSAPVLGALVVVHLFCRGLVGPNAQHIALEPMAERAGVASAALGVSQILAAVMASALVAVALPFFGGLAMAGVMAVLTVSSLLLWRRRRA